ncbi:mRNA cleavage and polyadenylation factor subunit [Elasticomyces elasticus]|uniref:mRNA cleavage and polyadenylation factor subunit n=1 Tax=Exophiala sideris TaxID=1016849 RepID=A0ABR0IYV7_9EURO|nr:mRNA cleavage and polyadenylation factor subunit [Elasticomyces elasticus]KAK5022111.1 mRNA cleavage and polyadenylation factor subunit [Exophiala sideris]KAK5025084.1 mRNA cleavage and polyadenylation factor subunit [Exophiala sideris]KAK5051178.1 mRNA cleavage and polyadenylation factor subunit [Exophiala sideris]KAK5176843.1 mRNA cleavage and polyadenylation factor subunit [Eurotiomycetes sp. CCFEE 6388]
MQCYTELLPPSGVTHALSLPFTSANDANLLVARTSLLQVFKCKQLEQGQETKLVLVAEYNLAGTVTSLGRVKTPDSKSGGDAVLIAFLDAKLSLIEWDPTLHSISTLSIHYYEHHDLHSAPWEPNLSECVSHLTIDPSSRCSAFNFGVSNLAIIPFHQTGDDLAMDDFDDIDGTEKGANSPTKQADTHTNGHETPHSPSFVLPLTVLDPGLLHPMDMTFLHEYRDPTIGILYSTAARSSNMSAERRDVTIYAVYALDLDQKASTTLQAVQKLPNDVYRIVALPPPVGGALLIGGNELIHIDQGGKSNAIAVNEFAKEASSFPMTDHSEYGLKLEGCHIEHLGNASGDMLVILKTGDLALLTFRLDGRSITSMALRRIGEGQMQSLLMGAASCTTSLGSNCLFIGSEESDSLLVSLAKRSTQLKRTTSRAQPGADGLDIEEDDADIEDEDDLYGEIANGHSSGDASAQTFRLMDRLPALAPINSITLGSSRKRKRGETDPVGEPNMQQQEIALAYGRGNAGGLAFVTKQLEPKTPKRVRYEGTHRIWCFSSAEKQTGKDKPFDDMAIISQPTADGVGKSSLLRLDDGDLSPVAYSEFDEAAGSTIAISQLKTTNHTIQVLPTEVRVYDFEFALSQIFPIVDEEEGQISKATKATFAEPYLAVVKEDGTMTLLKADKAGELDEVELPDVLTSKSISSVSLYADTHDYFQASRFYSGGTSRGPVLAALTSEGHFCMLSLPNISIQLFQCDSLPFLPTYLMQDLQLPKHWRNKDELSEILLADLGDKTSLQPFLVLRNVTGDVVLYEPFPIPEVVGSFKFRKVATKPAQDAEDQTDEDGYQSTKPSMEVIRDFGSHASVIVPGYHPFVILKEASTMPHIYELAAANMRSVSAVNLSMCRQGFAFVDDQENILFAELPGSMMIGQTDWAIKRVPLGQDVSSVAYFEPTESYVLAANYPTDFQLPQDDEWHPEWQTETTRFLPTTLQSSLKLLSSKSHSIISQYHFDACERILCLKCLNLEISEETHERKDLIVVGTAIVKGENVTTRGNIYIFDVVEVVPEPDVPESDVKLKLITREDVRGAVSALCDVGSQGFVLAAQGQKCMVRGLKEDMSILPVAFLDMRYYVHVAKELRGTGLCILGDAFSGLWLVGYSEEPYKLQILGRDLENPPVLAAEFLPSGKELFIISSDESGVLRVLQFDPEDPKAERGTKLLLRSTFNAGATPTQMLLLPPATGTAFADSDAGDMDLDVSQQSTVVQRMLVSTQSGSLCMLTSLPDAAYRRLSTLQNTLLTTLDFQPCSLNPRAYRQVETDGVGGRGMIDGNFVRRWWETSTQQRVASADKAGGSVWEVRGDMGLISGDDLGI